MYTQDDEKWGNLPWYDEDISALFENLTREIQLYSRNLDNSESLLNHSEKLHDKLNKIVESGALKQKSNPDETLAKSGCWHTSVANMLAAFDILLDEEEATPQIFLNSLQNRMLGTLTGYTETPFVDPLSIITEGKVQLATYRNFGFEGVKSNSAELHELMSTVDSKTVSAIANVREHEILGKKGNPHYVLINRALGNNDYEIQDPGWPGKKYLKRYKRIYQLSVYQKF